MSALGEAPTKAKKEDEAKDGAKADEGKGGGDAGAEGGEAASSSNSKKKKKKVRTTRKHSHPLEKLIAGISYWTHPAFYLFFRSICRKRRRVVAATEEPVLVPLLATRVDLPRRLQPRAPQR